MDTNQIIKSSISGDIVPGDFIIVASGNYLDIGFYVGRGKSGSLQYYLSHSLEKWYDVRHSTKKKPYKCYINIVYESRIAKYHPECTEGGIRHIDYDKVYKALEILKIKKQENDN